MKEPSNENQKEKGEQLSLEVLSEIDEALDINLSDNKEENIKVIHKNSFLMELSILELPFFLFSYYKGKYKSVKELEKEIKKLAKKKEISFEEAENIYEKEGKKKYEVEVQEFDWVDSKNFKKKWRMESSKRLPRRFEFDVYYHLLELFFNKMSPTPYDKDAGVYQITTRRFYFTFYELALFMGLEPSGSIIENIKEAIRVIGSTKYYAYTDGVFFDKANEKWINSTEESIQLITEYSFSTSKSKSTTKDLNWVEFGGIIINNIKHEYFKYLNNKIFHTLQSGLPRRIYTYLEKNRYINKSELPYLKRSYEVLANKIPLEYGYLSELKRKLIPVFDILIEKGYIKGYILGDEMLPSKEESVYFCFSCTTEYLIKELKKKGSSQLRIKGKIMNSNAQNLKISETATTGKSYLKIPMKPIKDELIDRGVSDKEVDKIILGKDRWEVIKYIIWIDKQKELNKTSDIPALLRTAIEVGYDIKKNNEIIEFVENEKMIFEKKEEALKKEVKLAYKTYADKEVSRFKNGNITMYNFIAQEILDNIDKNVSTLTQLKLLLNEVKTEKEKEKLQMQIKELEDFIEHKEKSERFKRLIANEIMTMCKSLSFEDFREKYIKENFSDVI